MVMCPSVLAWQSFQQADCKRGLLTEVGNVRTVKLTSGAKALSIWLHLRQLLAAATEQGDTMLTTKVKPMEATPRKL